MKVNCVKTWKTRRIEIKLWKKGNGDLYKVACLIEVSSTFVQEKKTIFIFLLYLVFLVQVKWSVALIMFLFKYVPLNISALMYTWIKIQYVPSLGIITHCIEERVKLGGYPPPWQTLSNGPFSLMNWVLQTQCSFRNFSEAAILFPVKSHIFEECQNFKTSTIRNRKNKQEIVVVPKCF